MSSLVKRLTAEPNKESSVSTNTTRRIDRTFVGGGDSRKDLFNRCRRHARMYATLVTARGDEDRRCFCCFEDRLSSASKSAVEPLAGDLEAFILTMSTTAGHSTPDEFRERLHRLLYQLDNRGDAAGTRILRKLSLILRSRPPLAKLASQAMLCIVRQLNADQLAPDLILRLAIEAEHMAKDSQIFIIQIISEAFENGVVSASELLRPFPSLLKVSHLHDVTPLLARLATEIIELNEQYSSLVAEAFLAAIELDKDVSPARETIQIVTYIASLQPSVMLPPSTDLLITLIDSCASKNTITFVCDTLRNMAIALKSAAFIGIHGFELRLSDVICSAVEGHLVLIAAQCLFDLAVFDPHFVDQGKPNDLFNRMTGVLQHSTPRLHIMIIGLLEVLIQCRQVKQMRVYYAELLLKFLFDKLGGEKTAIAPFVKFSMKLLMCDKLPPSTPPAQRADLLTGCVNNYKYSVTGVDVASLVVCTNLVVDGYVAAPSEDFASAAEDLVSKVLTEVNRSRTACLHRDGILSLVSKCCEATRARGAPMELISSPTNLAWDFLENCFESAERRSYCSSLVCCLDPQEDPASVLSCMENISDERLTPAEVYYELLLAKIDHAWESNDAWKIIQQLRDLLDRHTHSWGYAYVSKANIVRRLLVERPNWAEIIVKVLQTKPELLEEVTLDADNATLIFSHLFDVLWKYWPGSGGQVSTTVDNLLTLAGRMRRTPNELDFICVKLARIDEAHPLSTIRSLLTRLVRLESNEETSRRIIALLSEETHFIDKLIADSSWCIISLELLHILSPAIEAGRASLSWVELKKLWNVKAGQSDRRVKTSSDLVSLIIFEILKKDSAFVVKPQPTIGEFREAWMRLLETTNESLFKAALNFLDPAAPSWMWEQAIFELLASLQAPKGVGMPTVFTALLLEQCIPQRTFKSMRWAILAAPWLAVAKDELPEHLWNRCSNELRKNSDQTPTC